MADDMQNPRLSKLKRLLGISILLLVVLYMGLLIPDSSPPSAKYFANKSFIWNQDSLWLALEARFLEVRKTDCNVLADSVTQSLLAIHNLLDTLESRSFLPATHIFAELENIMFGLAPAIGACPSHLMDYLSLFSRLRNIVKNQSIHWDMNSAEARRTIYRLLYGGRAAVEEVMLQASPENLPACVYGYAEPSQTPAAEILGVTIHSGDILVSRGGAPTSALIARGNDYPGNFSHIALVYVDEQSERASIVESHIERGVAVATVDEYLNDKKLRVMVLRLRADLPKLIEDPFLPHRAAKLSISAAKTQHIPYDFEMDYRDHDRLFCSEVASAPYEEVGIKLWMGISSISSPGVVRWLSSFGVKYFETQEPSDLEYDPQFRVVAEWRDPETLFKDHIDNAVTDAMLEDADSGAELDYSRYMLPVARMAKFYSMILNQFNIAGPVPEGMSASAALRNQQFSEDHNTLVSRVEKMVSDFRGKKRYTPPYWQLLELARKAGG